MKPHKTKELSDHHSWVWQRIWLISTKDHLTKTVILLHKDIYRHLLQQQHHRAPKISQCFSEFIISVWTKIREFDFCILKTVIQSASLKTPQENSLDPQKQHWGRKTLKHSGNLPSEMLTWTIRGPRSTTIRLKPDSFFSYCFSLNFRWIFCFPASPLLPHHPGKRHLESHPGLPKLWCTLE